MAAKGTIAKLNVKNAIKEAFGPNYIGEVDKKIYVWAQENGERVQIALSMTCPKTPIEIESDGNFDWSNSSPEITPEEKETINKLMEKLKI